MTANESMSADNDDGIDLVALWRMLTPIYRAVILALIVWRYRLLIASTTTVARTAPWFPIPDPLGLDAPASLRFGPET
jgi:hypothetical protein